MLQVRKKTKRGGGRKRLLLIILALLAAGGTGAYLLLRAENEPLPKREETGGAILETGPGQVQRVRIHVRGREPWSAERNEDGALRMTSGGDWVLSETRAEQVMDALENLVYEDILTENAEDYRDHLADFGLEEPALTA